MNDILPEAVRKGLEEARVAMLRKSNRLCVHDGDNVFRLRRIWDGGFSLDAAGAPLLRGHVALYDGPRHVADCLVIGSEEAEGERLYEYKRQTAALDRPPLDYAPDSERPAGLIPRLL
ncbi:hypothetical protein [Wenxinia saemankumensis]|uniref:Uncharacterized protein n=1 Tax=Wenxinia saemankumensis TaxID=1447782 RepID=A0A1M6EGH2_9RHOB|nr:hypothetical protein [Wenxinia saemankumensis]SHI84617.1 hypothetical protein SAMN05444417_1990 [Wenxinia saemankumensis]